LQNSRNIRTDYKIVEHIFDLNTFNMVSIGVEEFQTDFIFSISDSGSLMVTTSYNQSLEIHNRDKIFVERISKQGSYFVCFGLTEDNRIEVEIKHMNAESPKVVFGK
jgi:hypothetical protein